MGSISKLVGEKIRMYRKLNHMTLDDVAAKVYKSSATLSKYENGSIIIDVETLNQIADVLGVRPECFLEGIQKPPKKEKQIARGFFRSSDIFYLYWSTGTKKGKIMRGLLEISHGEKEDSAMIYVCTDSDFSKTSAISVYRGTMVYTDVYTRVYAENITNPIDYIFLHILEEFNSFSFVNAMEIGMATNSCKPVACLVLISKERQTENKTLLERLLFGKEEIQFLKKGNYFSIQNTRMM